ncbi:hypothetical protein F4604DRAFT_1689021 [Suillus subluteus]|nr:hypothetical protein F4604DRAFT_1689021 [Suillus subluteus]
MSVTRKTGVRRVGFCWLYATLSSHLVPAFSENVAPRRFTRHFYYPKLPGFPPAPAPPVMETAVTSHYDIMDTVTSVLDCQISWDVLRLRQSVVTCQDNHDLVSPTLSFFWGEPQADVKVGYPYGSRSAGSALVGLPSSVTDAGDRTQNLHLVNEVLKLCT